MGGGEREWCKILSFYRSPSQNRGKFEKFLENLELSIDHIAYKAPYIMLILGDFNAKLDSWYAYDNKNIKGSKIGILTANFGFNQIINKPTHILNNSSFCTDLNFYMTTESSNRIRCLSFSSRTLSPSNKNIKFNLNVIYPPPYKREVWHYKLENSYCIQLAIANFDWEKAFHDVDVNKQVCFSLKLSLILFETSFLMKL